MDKWYIIYINHNYISYLSCILSRQIFAILLLILNIAVALMHL